MARSITSVYVFIYVAACVLGRSVVLGEGELPKYKNHYYYLSPFQEMTHPEANTECQKQGGYLAEINDQDELDFIANEVMNRFDGSNWYHFTRIGGKWSGTRDAGKWVFMTSGDDVTYTYPDPDAYQTMSPGEGLCLGLYRGYDSASGRYNGPWFTESWRCASSWNDHNLCEIPAATTPTPTLTPTAPAKPLPQLSSLPKYKNHYYYLTPKEEMTHPEANTRCRQHGGYLVEIADADELDFIANEVVNGLVSDVWYHFTRIGAECHNCHRTSYAKKWVFMTSGDDVTYTYTEPGEIGLPKVEGWCLALYGGRYGGPWYMMTMPCSATNMRNICEIPAA